jgi:hypothetical protein
MSMDQQDPPFTEDQRREIALRMAVQAGAYGVGEIESGADLVTVAEKFYAFLTAPAPTEPAG